MMKTTLIALAALVAVPSAFAAPAEIAIEFSVEELRSDSGLAAINQRIETQANEACLIPSTTRVDHTDQACVAELVDAAAKVIADERAAL